MKLQILSRTLAIAMKTASIISLFFIAALASPFIDKNAKIVGGENAVEHQAPFMVTLQVDRVGSGVFSHTCGGVDFERELDSNGSALHH